MKANPDCDTTIEVSLPTALGAEKLVRQLIGWLGPRVPLASERVADLQTAVSEACINAIEHGNQGRRDLRFGVTVTLTSRYLVVIVSDAGMARFRPPAAPPPCIQDKLAGRAPARCMGLLLIQYLADDAGFLCEEPGYGNRFRIRLYYPAQQRTS